VHTRNGILPALFLIEYLPPAPLILAFGFHCVAWNWSGRIEDTVDVGKPKMQSTNVWNTLICFFPCYDLSRSTISCSHARSAAL
jgi:hypothetical protein